MTTDAAPNLETRLQRWLSESMTAWKRDNQWLLTHSDEAASLLKHQAAELTACRAEQARLDEEIAEAREACPIVRQQDYFDAPLKTLIDHEISQLFQMQSRAETAAAQVSTLTAALRRQIDEWYRRAGEYRREEQETWQERCNLSDAVSSASREV